MFSATILQLQNPISVNSLHVAQHQHTLQIKCLHVFACTNSIIYNMLYNCMTVLSIAHEMCTQPSFLLITLQTLNCFNHSLILSACSTMHVQCNIFSCNLCRQSHTANSRTEFYKHNMHTNCFDDHNTSLANAKQ